jgi:hypothetical protein
MGGTMANDEQVMCVAAPIAIANGFDIDGFAKLLWNYSLGYQDSSNQDVTTRYLNGILSCFHYYYTGVGDSIIFDNMLTPFDESVISFSGVFGNYWDGDRTIPPPAPGTNTINALDQTYSDDPMGWWQPYCQNVIDNAWVANWGILCRDAFELAKRIKQSNRRHGLPLTNLSNVEV